MTIPYIKVPDFHLGPLPLHPFGLLVATGVIIGTALAMRRGRIRGFDLDKLNSFITWMLAMGFIGGHVLDSIFYHPDEVLRRPLSILMLWEGLSSFGGFVGGLIGVLIWKYVEWECVRTYYPSRPERITARVVMLVAVSLLFITVPALRSLDAGHFRVPAVAGALGALMVGPQWSLYRPRLRAVPFPVLPFCDLILSVFPVAWIFGRSGCSSVHDHPGALTSTWLGVDYPDPRPQVTEGPGVHTSFGPITFIQGHYPRFDLGLLELMFTCILALAFALTWRKKLRTGTYIVVVALAYGPVRFAMDFLRLTDAEGSDPRYGGFTPAQWCCIGLVALGFVILAVMRDQKKRGVDPADALRVA